MRFHVDTRSAASEDSASAFDFRNRIDAKGGFKVGPWGVDAKMSNTIGYVSTQQSQRTEEMNVDLDLNSSVELYFRTDYLPLETLATGQQYNGQHDQSRGRDRGGGHGSGEAGRGGEHARARATRRAARFRSARPRGSGLGVWGRRHPPGRHDDNRSGRA
jgi:hypothetical protein